MYSIKEIRKLCKECGLELLENSYKGYDVKYKVVCQKGHITNKLLSSIVKKTGCWHKECRGVKIGDRLRKSLSNFYDVAEKANITILSLEYKGAREKLKWQCNICGHIWEAEPYSIKGAIKRGTSGCPSCSGLAFNSNLLLPIINERGGSFLKRWTNEEGRCLLSIKCNHDHIFNISSPSLKKGYWCPVCSQTFGEKLCKFYFESFFEKEFKKVRPDWLRSDSGYRLELDGYNEELHLAFEHNGEHHYSTKNIYIRDEKTLARRKKLDKIKNSTCKKYNVKLITIPAILTRLKKDDVGKFIYDELLKNNLLPLKHYSDITIDYDVIYTPSSDRIFLELQQKASFYNGSLLDTCYRGYDLKYSFKCSEGHIFESSVRSILRGNSWCPICRGGVKKDISLLYSLGDKLKLTLISSEYRGTKIKYDWKCEKNHLFSSSVDLLRHYLNNQIKHSSCCPTCREEIRHGYR